MPMFFKTLSSLSVITVALTGNGVMAAEKDVTEQIAALGQALYFDVSLSKSRTQSCATCHNPNHAFVDDRENGVGQAVSMGEDGKSLGDRNAPSVAYAKFSPKFHRNKAGDYRGGQFLDGRASSLSEQAGGPPLNPVEMAMPDKISVVERLESNAYYQKAFKEIFGEDVFETPATAYRAMSDSLEAFERTDLFSPFDSKYDRYLKGEVELTKEESLGESLFFSQQFTNCNRCHQLKAFPGSSKETFTNYEYHNLGVPVNSAARKANGLGQDFVDEGLLGHPDVNDPTHRGKFKVPTLRNVAVTGPYMHNGVFKDLRTVILFYDKFNNETRTHNPETNQPWQPPEVNQSLALEDKEFDAPALKDREIDALVAFLKTLTDKRYEVLLTE